MHVNFYLVFITITILLNTAQMDAITISYICLRPIILFVK